MERNVEDLISRQKLVFAKNPFEKIFHSKVNNPKTESRLVIEAPTKLLISQPRFEHNFPKSDLSKLRIDPPSERKEFIKMQEKKLEISQLSLSGKCLPELKEIPKEDWEKIDFIKLEKWHLQQDRYSNDIAIIGYRSDIEESWLSDYVLARIDEKRIITKSKTYYRLIGMIDSSSQESKAISSKFETGFPENWKEIIIKK